MKQAAWQGTHKKKSVVINSLSTSFLAWEQMSSSQTVL